MSIGLHPASDSEARSVWASISRSHLFESASEFERFRAAAPWRVQVTGRGEAVVLERWRAHLDILAVRGLWCAPRRIPELMADSSSVARVQGYGRILSPLVPTEMNALYESAGMDLIETVLILRRGAEAGEPTPVTVRASMRIRRAVLEDLDTLVALDAACFDEFWRYDSHRLARHLAEDRMVVAEEDAAVIGYTLVTLMGGAATLGRLAVSPPARGRGVGAILLSEALGYLARTAAGPVSLCTQEANVVSRSLYAAAGLRELPGRLHFFVRSVGGD